MPFGDEAVRLAREAVESEVLGRPLGYTPTDPRFSEPSGAFVTISTFPDHGLRGCIGIPLPLMPLGDAVERAGRSACHDPRFPDLTEGELGGVTVEVTVLTVPQMIEGGPDDVLRSIEIGRDGLIIECAGRSGLLLPQVPVEWGWDAETYLEHLSMKAGLPAGAWRRPDARISAFRGEMHTEAEPRSGLGS